MSSTTTQTAHSQRFVPDLSFPPRYASKNTPPISSRIQSQPRQPPAFNFPKISSNSTNVPSIPLPQITTNQSPLLLLPLEIRLQIYHHVISTHLIFHPHLAPPPTLRHPSVALQTKPIEELHTTIFRPLGQSLPTTTMLTTTTLIPATRQPISTLHPQSTPTIGCKGGIARGKIPTGLLASCRQIYEEARLFPWEQNSFSFINWFWSGVYASRQFMRSLSTWQSGAMRWVGVEVLSRDLTAGAELKGRDMQYLTEEEAVKGRTEWEELCHLWKGVWGLRLGVKGSVRPKKAELAGYDSQTFTSAPEELSLVSGLILTPDKGILDTDSHWIKDGLLTMKNLRWVELEIEDEDVSRGEKMRFCQDLETALNASRRQRAHGWDGAVKVVFVEKIKESENMDVAPNLQYEWFGGAPGDDSIDGVY